MLHASGGGSGEDPAVPAERCEGKQWWWEGCLLARFKSRSVTAGLFVYFNGHDEAIGEFRHAGFLSVYQEE